MTMKYGNLMRDKMLLNYGFEKPNTHFHFSHNVS